MTRHSFGGDLAAFVIAPGDSVTVGAITGNQVLLVPSAVVTFWTAATGGTQITDLVDSLGTPATSITAGSAGEIPSFSGPDTTPDTWTMWADASGGAGPRRMITATDVGNYVGSNSASIDTLTATVDEQAVLLGTSLGVVSYNVSTSSWPTRPTDSRVYLWIGPTAPPVGGGYMADGVDFWLNGTPA